MKLFFIAIIFALSASITATAQITASGSGTVTGKTQNQNQKQNNGDVSAVDFKNFTFPDFIGDGKVEKTFTLVNGTTNSKKGMPNYTLRKTYLFDLTGDQKDEAISHILVNGCQLGCESSSIFYVYTMDRTQPKLLWKIAIGGDTLGGLKSAKFNIKEIVIEVFGDCANVNSLIKSNVDLKKNPVLRPSNYTRFVFTAAESVYSETSRDVLPLTANVDIAEYRPQISFGN